MSKKLIKISFVVLVLALLGGLAATIQPQLTQDEQSVIVDAVLKTINPEGLAHFFLDCHHRLAATRREMGEAYSQRRHQGVTIPFVDTIQVDLI